MILRRVIKHFREQEWTAIFLDFLIVVVGVFVGLQVSNWSEARRINDREQAYLVELRAEIFNNNVLRKQTLTLTGITVAAGERSLAFLEAGKPCQEGCWRLLVDFFHASQVAARQTSLEVFEEMQRQGLPHSDELKTSLKDYSINVGALATVSQGLPKYRERIRGLLPVDVQRDLWRDCHSITAGGEDYITDCQARITESEASAILDNIRVHTEIHELLTFWIGQSIANLAILNNEIDMGDAIIATIDDELENQK